MPKVNEHPDTLRPYIFHGVNLEYKASSRDAVGDCPWCSRQGKFLVKIETGEWQCFKCHEGSERGGGNSFTFVRTLWKYSSDATEVSDYAELAEARKISPETLIEWSVVKSSLTGEWIIPGYNTDGTMVTLYKYVRGRERTLLLPTPTMGSRLFGVDLYEGNKPGLYLCEGPWDAMALWETLASLKESDGRLVPTANKARSLLAGSNVIAVPGCMTFSENWDTLFSGRDVRIMFDNDHPVVNPKTKAIVTPASRVGAKRVCGVLTSTPERPSSLKILSWSRDIGVDFDPSLPAGYDVRDHLTSDMGRLSAMEDIISRLVDPPAEWIHESSSKPTNHGSRSVDLADCTRYKTLVNSWRKALRWTPGLDCALSVMLASITSTKIVGDQLWVKIIGPAACGKSTLCEAVSSNHEYVLAKSTIRGFHSGYGDGEEDCSLISLLYGKTLVTKDGDTLLQSPNLGQILSEARDVYDSVSRTHYRNKNSRDYSGVRMTWILCGTSSLRSIDSSELGERFLDCVVMEGIDDDLEDEILWRVVNRAARNMSIESDGKIETHYDPEMVSAMSLTGGYVSYLRQNAPRLLDEVEKPKWALKQCMRLGKFVAIMRARPSKMQEETAERELGSRLTSQLIRLASCLAVVLNEKTIEENVMERVRKVAMDTARGITLNICRCLVESPEGLELRSLSLHTAMPESKLHVMLRFLHQIGAVKLVAEKRAGVTKRLWRLTDKTNDLFSDVNLSIDDLITNTTQ